MLSIIGCGPRGLALALIARERGIEFQVFDAEPIHTWQTPNILSGINMRSPLTFDLVTGLRLPQYSLMEFLGYKPLSLPSQAEIELYPIRCSRAEFLSYLEWIKCGLNSYIINDNVIEIGLDFVRTPTKCYPSDYIAVCLGESVAKPVVPEWVANTHLPIIQPRDIERTTRPEYYVVGSGQRAAETCITLKDKAPVTLFYKRPWRVEEYPAPSWKDWYYRSALGPYYRQLASKHRANYLKEVKAWQPSITPEVAAQLKGVKLVPPGEIEITNAAVVLATGTQPKLSLVPLQNPIKQDCLNPNLPLLSNGFKSSQANLYFSGTLATGFDGPRQASVISAGMTAWEITSDILQCSSATDSLLTPALTKF